MFYFVVSSEGRVSNPLWLDAYISFVSDTVYNVYGSPVIRHLMVHIKRVDLVSTFDYL